MTTAATAYLTINNLPIPDGAASLLQRQEVLLAGLVLAVVLLLWVARRVRKIARGDRPDEALSNLVMVIGLGWSSEAVWEIARDRLHFSIGLTLLLFFVFENLLMLAMIRAKRHMRQFGWPGRFGTTAWTVAGSMSIVAMAASHSIEEAALRMLIPLLVTKQWWDGLVGGAAKRPADASTWRWTPRRLLLALGAIEPGARDVQTVHRERLTQQMTTLYHQYTHGPERLRDRRASRLARLSLTADDAIIAEVKRRGDRAQWFEANRYPETFEVPEVLPVPAAPDVTDAGPAPTPTVNPNPAPPAPAAPEPVPDPEPAPAPDRPQAPTPVEIAARINPNPTTTATRPALVDERRTAPPRPHKARPGSPAPTLAPSTTDTPVTASDAAQLTLPVVPPDLLKRATEVARAYRSAHGTPITAGQLAVRLKVQSDVAAQAIEQMDLLPDNPTQPVPTVNGNRPQAAR